MHLYKHFWKMLRSNRAGLIIYASIAAVMILMIGIIGNSVAGTDEEQKIVAQSVDISYIDQDNSVLSKGIIEFLSKNNEVTDYSSYEQNEINNLVYFSVTEYHLEIPEGFQEAVEKGENPDFVYNTNAGQASYIYSLTNDINTYVNLYKNYISKELAPEDAVEKTYDLMTKELEIKVQDKGVSNGIKKKDWSIYEMSVYFIYVSLGMVLMSAGSVIINSNEENVSKRMAITPSSPVKRSIVDTLGLYSFGIVIWLVVCVGFYLFGQNSDLMQEKGHLIAIQILLSVLVNCSLTAFVVSFQVPQNILSMLCNVIGLSMSFMCGVFVPQWFLGDGVLIAARCMPFYWSVRALNMIYPQCGAGLSFHEAEVFNCFGMQLVFIVLFAVASVVVRKIRKR